MTCPTYGEDCYAISHNFISQGTGSVLIVLSEITSGADTNRSFTAGTQGRSLNELLVLVGLRDTDVTIRAIETCRSHSLPRSPRFFNELARERYDSIITMGEAALAFLGGRAGLKDKRGKPQPVHKDFGQPNDVHFIPTYGTDLLQRVPSFKRVVLSDMRSALGTAKSPEAVEWKYWTVAG